MARSIKHHNLQRPDLELLVVHHLRIRLQRWDEEWKLEQPCLHIRMLSLGLIQRVEQYPGRGKPLLNDRMIGKVVEVAVRQPQPGEVPSPGGCFFEQRTGGMVGCVKKHCLPSRLVPDRSAKWSKWPCVNHSPVRSHPRAAASLSSGPVVWSGASKSTACPAASSAIRKQFVIATPPVFVSMIMPGEYPHRLWTASTALAGEEPEHP